MRMIIIPEMQMRIIFISALTIAAIAFAACGSDDEDSAGDGPEVVATTGIVADIVGNVAGPDVQVEQLIPNGASPHDFQLSAEERQTLAEADLVAANGSNLEPGVPLDDVESPVWELTANVNDLLAFEKGGSDPHVWMDPTRVVGALPSLADALAEADPDHATAYRKRADAYAHELLALDDELTRATDRVPEDDRELVTSHDALGYFADHFGFEVVATAFPATGAEGEPSASALADVAEAISARDVPAVFAGEEDDPEVLRQVADEAGVEVVDDLLIESPGSAGTYEAMLEHDAERIATALSP
jgi:zinc/manganese transport system substrate-binding protein